MQQQHSGAPSVLVPTRAVRYFLIAGKMCSRLQSHLGARGHVAAGGPSGAHCFGWLLRPVQQQGCSLGTYHADVSSHR